MYVLGKKQFQLTGQINEFTLKKLKKYIIIEDYKIQTNMVSKLLKIIRYRPIWFQNFLAS